MIIDVRTQEEYSEGYVKGAKNIPVDIIGDIELDASLDENIQVYCRSGGRARLAKSILEKRGFINVSLYNNGRCQ